jgi:glycosyltransferase involved in cell wall biosynthesis
MGYVLHLLALPHTVLAERDSSCAYSMKVLKAVPMMQAEGHRVILYGPDVVEAEPDEHVVITTEADRERWGFGGGFNTALSPFLWDWNEPYWFEANTRAIDAIRERMPEDRRGHFLCLITSTQKPIADAIATPQWNNPLTVEWGVGYEGITGPFCAFESYCWQHHVYGLKGWRNGRAFDAVIPNFFDRRQFSRPKKPSADYLLYMGRVVKRKGPDIAAMIAERAGLPLKVAGPGPTEWSEGKIVAPEVTLEGNVEYVGEVGYAERNELLGNAYALIVPTIYLEPFGGVAVEAMLTGCPVVASDWGAFAETVTPEVGRLFRTPKQGLEAVREVADLDRKRIREYALGRYSLEAVGPMFTRWFSTLDTLWATGFYE